ncbi:hypothetical protein TI04_05860 [Achromatium sp. WMS2]|nr:hypothetical protein TI04_05860 [Achromatium sp. WMS2]
MLGIPTLFAEFDRFFSDSAPVEDVPGEGIMASYTVRNAVTLRAVQVKAVKTATIETPQYSAPVIYISLNTGERFMAMDMDVFRNLGVSNAAIAMSKTAYTKAKNIRPGMITTFQVTGEAPLPLILAGVEALIIGIN